MKANERKELEHNILLTQLTRWKEKLKGRPAYIIIGTIVLTIAIIFIVREMRTSNLHVSSTAFFELSKANTDKALDEIIASETHRGKPTAIYAKIQKARLDLYREGLDKLGTSDAQIRKAAYAKIEEGRKLYLEVVNDLKDSPALQQEAWVGCAKAEEVLLAVPKEDNDAEFRGSFDKMLEYYRKAAAIEPNSDISKSYAAEADKMQGQRTQIEDFYKELSRINSLNRTGLK